MNIVVVDYRNIAPDADFPLLQAADCRWTQYPALGPEEIAERCWRADILVTAATPITREIIEQLPRLKMIVVAGGNASLVDEAAAQASDICVTPLAPAPAESLCRQSIDVMDAFIAEWRE